MTPDVDVETRAVPGYIGGMVNHIFPTCPALRRLGNPRDGGDPRQLSSRILPESPDAEDEICGTCLQKWERLSESKKDWLAR